MEPLLLPISWFSKSYVQRDLAVMGLLAEGVDLPILIKNATVINKTRHSHFWVKSEVDAVMNVMGIERSACDAGSALYLSRKGQYSEGPQRQIANDLTEEAMHSAGVKVVRTSGLGPEDYRQLAPLAETLFFDHGSAGDNMIFWQTRRVVELFGPAPNYWDPSFLFLADCLGIRDYHLWEISPQESVANLTGRIQALRIDLILESSGSY